VVTRATVIGGVGIGPWKGLFWLTCVVHTSINW